MSKLNEIEIIQWKLSVNKDISLCTTAQKIENGLWRHLSLFVYKLGQRLCFGKIGSSREQKEVPRGAT